MLTPYIDGCRHGAYVPYRDERNVHLPMMDLLLSRGALLPSEAAPLAESRAGREHRRNSHAFAVLFDVATNALLSTSARA